MSDEPVPGEPRTRAQWFAAVDALTPPALVDALRAANRADFVTGLVDDGIAAQDVEDLFAHWAARVVAAGAPLPLGGYFNLSALGPPTR